MPATRPSEDFQIAAQSYLNDGRFSDFTIVCEDKEFKVHRCFISAHSKYFEKACGGMLEVRYGNSQPEMERTLTPRRRLQLARLSSMRIKFLPWRK